LDNVWASKTSLTELAINTPSAENSKAERNRTVIRLRGFATTVSRKKIEKRTIKPPFIIPNTAPPRIFPRMIPSKEIGARRRRSNDPIRFSNVRTIAHIEVVPNRTDIPTNPGTISRMPEGFLIEKARTRAAGNMIPQLIFGGLK